MSDPPKSAPFSFNSQATSGSNSNIFGQPSTTSMTTSSLFGQVSGGPVPSNPSPFSSVPATSGTSSPGVFGSRVTTGSGLFGDKSNSAGFSFGQNTASSTLSKSFDTEKAGPATNQSSSSNAPSLGFTTLSTPNKLSETTMPSQTQTTGLFGGGRSTGESGLFGSASTITGASGQPETSTPTSKPSASFSFGASTTPAGPPPTDSIGTGTNSGSIFSMNKSQETKGSLFPSANTTQSVVPPASTFSGFGMSAKDTGGIFGSKPAVSNTSGSIPQTTSSLFNKSATDTATGIFGKSGATSQSSTGILGKPKDSDSDGLASTAASGNTPNTGVQSQTANTNPYSIFNSTGMTGGQSTQASSMLLFCSPSQD